MDTTTLNKTATTLNKKDIKKAIKFLQKLPIKPDIPLGYRYKLTGGMNVDVVTS